MNVLVTGAGGQLGREMQIVSRESSSSDRFFFTDVCGGYEFLDITDASAVREFVAANKIEAIVNCAAWTDVDGAETAGDVVRVLNADAPANLAAAMKEVGGLLVHISTDYVFGAIDSNVPCTEDMPSAPAGVYARTKLQGEENVRASGCDHVILRTAWLYSEFGKNFCRTILRLLREKPSIKVVFDQVGTPTYALDLARAICRIISDRSYVGNSGIYHYSDEGVCSWYDFAKLIQKFSGLDGCSILPCHSSEFPSPVRRPSYSVLDKTKVKSVFGVDVPYWTDSLKECINALSRIESGL